MPILIGHQLYFLGQSLEKKYTDPNGNSAVRHIKSRPVGCTNVEVKKVNDKGISVQISKNIEGFIRLNEVDEKRLSFEEIEAMIKPGEKREALVVTSDYERKRIYLSFRAVEKKREREEIEKYGKSGNEGITTVGDLFQNALDNKK